MQQIRSSLVLACMLRVRSAANNDLVLNNNIMMLNMNQQQKRGMVGRGSNRSGVHGTHLPPTHTLDDVEGVQKEIGKGMKDKESKRKHVEHTVDSHLNKSRQHPNSSSDKN